MKNLYCFMIIFFCKLCLVNYSIASVFAKEKNKEIFQAIKDHDEKAVVEIIKKNNWWNFAQDEEGYIPLSLAAKEGYFPVVDVLVTYGAVQFVEDTSQSPLAIALANKKYLIARRLLQDPMLHIESESFNIAELYENFIYENWQINIISENELPKISRKNVEECLNIIQTLESKNDPENFLILLLETIGILFTEEEILMAFLRTEDEVLINDFLSKKDLLFATKDMSLEKLLLFSSMFFNYQYAVHALDLCLSYVLNTQEINTFKFDSNLIKKYIKIKRKKSKLKKINEVSFLLLKNSIDAFLLLSPKKIYKHVCISEDKDIDNLFRNHKKIENAVSLSLVWTLNEKTFNLRYQYWIEIINLLTSIGDYYSASAVAMGIESTIVKKSNPYLENDSVCNFLDPSNNFKNYWDIYKSNKRLIKFPIAPIIMHRMKMIDEYIQNGGEYSENILKGIKTCKEVITNAFYYAQSYQIEQENIFDEIPDMEDLFIEAIAFYAKILSLASQQKKELYISNSFAEKEIEEWELADIFSFAKTIKTKRHKRSRRDKPFKQEHLEILLETLIFDYHIFEGQDLTPLLASSYFPVVNNFIIGSSIDKQKKRVAILQIFLQKLGEYKRSKQEYLQASLIDSDYEDDTVFYEEDSFVEQEILLQMMTDENKTDDDFISIATSIENFFARWKVRRDVLENYFHFIKIFLPYKK